MRRIISQVKQIKNNINRVYSVRNTFFVRLNFCALPVAMMLWRYKGMCDSVISWRLIKQRKRENKQDKHCILLFKRNRAKKNSRNLKLTTIDIVTLPPWFRLFGSNGSRTTITANNRWQRNCSIMKPIKDRQIKLGFSISFALTKLLIFYFLFFPRFVFFVETKLCLR